MSTVRRITKNTLVTIAGEIAGKILTLIFMIYAARYLQAEGFGILSFALAFTGIFGIFPDIGFFPLIVREVARDKSAASKYVGNIVIIKAVLVAGMFGIMCLIINLMGYPYQTVKAVYILGLAVVLEAFSMIFRATFQAFEKLEYISIGKILKNSLLVSGAFFIMHKGLGLIGFAVLYPLASSVSLIYNLGIGVKKFVKPKLGIDVKFWKWIMKEGAPFWLSDIFWVIYFSVDSVMLSIIVGDVAVGLYNAAYKLVFTLSFIPTALIASIFPVTSRLYTSSRDTLRFAWEKSFKYLFMLGVAIGVGTTFLADKIILLLYGSEYASSAIALKILIWAEVAVFLSVALVNLLNSINKQIIVTKVTGTLAILNVIMNLLLIPEYSYVGASIATVITEFLSFMFLFSWISRSEYRLPNRNILSIVLKTGFAGLTMGGFIKYFGNINVVILVILSVLIYFAIIYLLRGFDETDMNLMRRLFKEV